ncbi:MAG TPA: glycine cleavage system aminomethyltransferase GcvT [Clostridiales bacterium]|nr:glycine cleavage system aminomethyltransferase GcvT [Clostridiales bacterium]HOL91656.1 glycine cleavage system aminomethyltransferase GcvT [Clostridiales bacterium]HPP36219.1 glycine cleavage system aminomethyltransferase GcvT [Clostridiales bacterium]
MENTIRKTPLYEAHVKAGGKMIDFHGWLLPVQYSSILKEHENVRTKAGLFDVSHMGEIEISGSDAFEFLQHILTNDITAKPGKAVYSPMCYADGGTVDDLIVYRQNGDSYLLVVNASNADKDFQWLRDNKKGNVDIKNRSDEYAQVALQGPESENILRSLTTAGDAREILSDLKFYRYVNEMQIGDVKVMLSRTGYTGEDGFELYCRPDDALKLWDMLCDAGAAYGLMPAGLGARDTLRLEAGLPLYGQELSETISPVMAGLGRFVKPGKGDFIGREALVSQMEGNLAQRLAGFEMIDRAIPRTGYEVYRSGRKVGHVTSGGFFPTLKKNMGIALVETSCADDDTDLEVMVRDKKYAARTVKLPFYKR